jgi:hypothetical protein
MKFQISVMSLVFDLGLQVSDKFFGERVFQIHGFTKRRQHGFLYCHVFWRERIIVVIRAVRWDIRDRIPRRTLYRSRRERSQNRFEKFLPRIGIENRQRANIDSLPNHNRLLASR